MLEYQSTKELAELVSRLVQSVATDKIFLLGQSVESMPVNSIFRPISHGKKNVTGYYMLLLTRPGESRSDDVIQDMLEQRNRLKTPVHLIVYPVKSFYQWLQNGQYFALRVAEDAPVIYNAGITSVPDPGYHMKAASLQRQELQAGLSLQHSKGFQAGADMFIKRSEYDLAAFLLHQATEHACLSFLLKHTGLRTGTHNIDKLLRYSTLINNVLINVFPRESQEDTALFRLLQKAYINSRYKEDYCISEKQILKLADRVNQLIRRCEPDTDNPLHLLEEPELSWAAPSGCRQQELRNARSSFTVAQTQIYL